ncbi:pyridoxamine 5'-phosphate oxidase family protein [Paenibacillus lemnae]|uniref:Pyridoxamine 5'-phosphate oxidase family protein n=1 Tax=Paenibacillus lemnae TaxID=1330551 RepID=A0A848M830_PAELE|nr:pyridoxamine 5'-phosphate oxidase family protein [Paenibacillus lemnae]NMO96350.1 pyridoxamine 5'-phosphate oxidase family protein [Paenibacillus lemnae]
MDRTQLEQKIAEALKDNKFCSFATVEGNKPKVRYMALFNDGVHLHLATDRKTHKVEELESNPNVYVLAGFEEGGTKELLEIEGRASVTKNDSLRRDLWNDDFKKWFNGPDDPDYVILDIESVRIEYTPPGGDRQVWEK